MSTTTSANPYHIDYLLAIGPTDSFKEATDDEDEDDKSPAVDLRARIDRLANPVKS